MATATRIRIAHNLAVSPEVAVVAGGELDELEKRASANTNAFKLSRFFDLRETSL